MDLVTEIINRLEQLEDLVGTTEPVMPHTSDKGHGRPEVRSISEAEHLSRRLSQVQDSLMKVKRVAEKKETEMCLLERHEERLKSIDTDLQGIKRDMLLIDDYESLAGRAGGFEEASFELRVAIKRLLKNVKAESAVDKGKRLSRVKLPQVSVSTFDGKVLNRKSFWKQFDTTIHCSTRLNNTEKLMYLQKALKDGPGRFVIQGLTQTCESYE